MSSSEIFYPFSNQPSTSNQNVFPYDLIVDTTFPGIIFDPTEAGGVYTVIREVNGSLWFVNNADWNPNSLQWTQEDPTNANIPAYALELLSTGEFRRFIGAATLVPGNPVNWQQVFQIDANGQISQTPLTITTPGQIQDKIAVTWNSGSLTQVTAREVDVTDTSSATNSILDNLVVNGTAVWTVDKHGVLVAGEIPFARVTGGPSFNNPTFTGTSTFNGPVIMNSSLTVNGGETVNTLNVTGSANINNPTFTGTVTSPSGAPLGDLPAYTTSGITGPALFSTVVIPITSSHGFPLGTGVIVAGTNGITTKSFAGYVTNNNGSPQTSITVTVFEYQFGSPGDAINSGAAVSLLSPISLLSVDGSISISNTGTALAPRFDIQKVPGSGFASQGASTVSNTFSLSIGDSTPGAVYLCTVNLQILTTAPANTGSITFTGTGSTFGGLNTWNNAAGHSWSSLTNGQFSFPLNFRGFANGVDTIVGTVATTGVTYASMSYDLLCFRIL